MLLQRICLFHVHGLNQSFLLDHECPTNSHVLQLTMRASKRTGYNWWTSVHYRKNRLNPWRYKNTWTVGKGRRIWGITRENNSDSKLSEDMTYIQHLKQCPKGRPSPRIPSLSDFSSTFHHQKCKIRNMDSKWTGPELHQDQLRQWDEFELDILLNYFLRLSSATIFLKMVVIGQLSDMAQI